MASSVYSHRFALGGAATADGIKTIYTVPAGHVAIVKCTTSYWGAGGTSNLYWLINGNAYDQVTMSVVGSTMRTELHVVLNEGDALQVYSPDGSWGYSAHGYLLTA